MIKTIIITSFTKKFVYIFMFIQAIIIFVQFWQFITMNPLQKNVYDLFMFIFNDYFFVTYLLTFAIIILFYRFNPSSSIHEYVTVKFKNRFEWFFVHILSVIFITFIYICGMVIFLILIAMINLDFQPVWSEFAIDKFHLTQSMILSYSPLSIVIQNVFLIYLYTVTLGLMIFITYIVFQHTVASMLPPILFTVFGVVTFLGKIDWLYPYSFTSHTLINIYEYGVKDGFASITVSVLYWFILIVMLIIVGSISIGRKDFNWGGK